MIETREQGAEMVSHTNEAINPLTVNDTADMSKQLRYIEQIETYAQYLHDHGRTETTIRNNRKSLRNIFRRVNVNDMDELTEIHIRYFIDHCGLKESSIKKYLINLDSMFYALRKEHPVKDMNILWNRNSYNRLFVDRKDFEKVLEHTKDKRTRMMLVFGAFMGLRTVEMERMLVKDISQYRILIRGKGHGTGYTDDMILPDIVRKELNDYLRWRTEKGVTLPYMFFMEKDGGYYPLEEGSNIIYNLIRRAGDRVGVRLNPHALRRLFATTLYYEVGTDIVTVRELMRHSSMATTMDNYIRCYPKKKGEAMDRLTTLYTHKDSTE